MRFRLNRQKHFASNNCLIKLICAFFLLLHAPLTFSWDSKFYNPKPDADDVVLPMRCDGAMVFKKVMVPVSEPMEDFPINIGGVDEEWGYVENTRPEYIAGSFVEKSGSSYYLIGKYEINRLQYAAVMDKKCPKVSMKGRLAQNKVNWFESIDFTNKYNLWLLQNAKDKLPFKDDDPGFIRLPTETEWEYAARGGVSIPSSSFQERLFPMEEDIKRYVWLAGTQSANGKVKLTGLLKPNPLNLYDMLGNVDEIVLEPFRLNKLSRELGQAGSFVVRGGSYLTSEGAMRTSIRHEIPFYVNNKLRKSKTTGFRVVLAASVLTSLAAIQNYQSAWQKLGKNIPKSSGSGNFDAKALDNPVNELIAISKAVTNDNMKKRLQNLIKVLRGSIEAKTEQTDRAAGAALRLGYFLCKGLSANAAALRPVKKRYEKSCKKKVSNEGYCKMASRRISQSEQIIKKNLDYYADTIPTTALDYSEVTLNQQHQVLTRILTERKLDSLIPYLDIYRKHLNQFASNGMIKKDDWFKQCTSIRM